METTKKNNFLLYVAYVGSLVLIFFLYSRLSPGSRYILPRILAVLVPLELAGVFLINLGRLLVNDSDRTPYGGVIISTLLGVLLLYTKDIIFKTPSSVEEAQAVLVELQGYYQAFAGGMPVRDLIGLILRGP